jgi:hypothetical protein
MIREEIDLPGLKESLEEMNLIGGMNMDKPKSGGIDREEARLASIAGQANAFRPAKEEMADINPDFILRRDFAAQIVSLQDKFLRVVEENDELREENQRLRAERVKILEIMGGK